MRSRAFVLTCPSHDHPFSYFSSCDWRPPIALPACFPVDCRFAVALAASLISCGWPRPQLPVALPRSSLTSPSLPLGPQQPAAIWLYASVSFSSWPGAFSRRLRRAAIAAQKYLIAWTLLGSTRQLGRCCLQCQPRSSNARTLRPRASFTLSCSKF